MSASITRSNGIPIHASGLRAGGGVRGLTAELDNAVSQAAEALASLYRHDVTVRFNSDRRSGGAWVLTNPEDGVWRNAEVGITAHLRDEKVTLHAYVKRIALAEGWLDGHPGDGVDIGDTGTLESIIAGILTHCITDASVLIERLHAPEAFAAARAHKPK